MNVDYGNILGQLVSTYGSTLANKDYTNTQKGLQGQLKQSYSDPSSVYNSQYRAMDQTFYKDLMAKAAAEGRATDAYKTGLAREAQFQNYLGQYRQGIQNQIQTNANTQSVNKQNNPMNAASFLVGSLLGSGVDAQGNKKPGALNDIVNRGVGSGIDSALGWMGLGSTPSQPQQYVNQNNYQYPVNTDSNYVDYNLSNPDNYSYSGSPSESAQNEYDRIYGNDYTDEQKANDLSTINKYSGSTGIDLSKLFGG